MRVRGSGGTGAQGQGLCGCRGERCARKLDENICDGLCTPATGARRACWRSKPGLGRTTGDALWNRRLERGHKRTATTTEHPFYVIEHYYVATQSCGQRSGIIVIYYLALVGCFFRRSCCRHRTILRGLVYTASRSLAVETGEEEEVRRVRGRLLLQSPYARGPLGRLHSAFQTFETSARDHHGSQPHAATQPEMSSQQTIVGAACIISYR